MSENQKNIETLQKLSKMERQVLSDNNTLKELINALDKRIYLNSQSDSSPYFSYEIEFIHNDGYKRYKITGNQEIKKEIDMISGKYLFLINKQNNQEFNHQKMDFVDGVKWELVVITHSLFDNK